MVVRRNESRPSLERLGRPAARPLGICRERCRKFQHAAACPGSIGGIRESDAFRVRLGCRSFNSPISLLVFRPLAQAADQRTATPFRTPGICRWCCPSGCSHRPGNRRGEHVGVDPLLGETLSASRPSTTAARLGSRSKMSGGRPERSYFQRRAAPGQNSGAHQGPSD